MKHPQYNALFVVLNCRSFFRFYIPISRKLVLKANQGTSGRCPYEDKEM
jgi:hypothetical protein